MALSGELGLFTAFTRLQIAHCNFFAEASGAISCPGTNNSTWHSSPGNTVNTTADVSRDVFVVLRQTFALACQLAAPTDNSAVDRRSGTRRRARIYRANVRMGDKAIEAVLYALGALSIALAIAAAVTLLIV